MSDPSAPANHVSSSRKLLLDTPAQAPALGYEEIGLGLAHLVSMSEPRFAVGIFGGWGSGKTTLMQAIKAALPKEDLVVVEFNAWRFEREPQLLVPLLDTIRAALITWSAQRQTGGATDKMRSIATRIGRVVHALARGLSADVGLPGAATIHYDVGAALDLISRPEDPDNAQSLYVAAFHELEKAFTELSENGVGRVVVFVDDLDRCLPARALEVLESMKLFFDLPGFVFVVGLDEDVVQRAVCVKFGDQTQHAEPGGNDAGGLASVRLASPSQRLSREYVKKIFQVPYTLPATMPVQLDDLLESMYGTSQLESAQISDLQQRILPYMQFVAVERRVNPREIKRFINAYTLQTLVRPELDPDTVLAVQTLAFRYEWRSLYNAVLADSANFIQMLRLYRQGVRGAFGALASELLSLPTDLAQYLNSPSAEPLSRYGSLDPYLSSLRAASDTIDTIGTPLMI